nr:MAG TPA: hypothetical protein [Caudoviricetes sp.]
MLCCFLLVLITLYQIHSLICDPFFKRKKRTYSEKYAL